MATRDCNKWLQTSSEMFTAVYTLHIRALKINVYCVTNRQTDKPTKAYRLYNS